MLPFSFSILAAVSLTHTHTLSLSLTHTLSHSVQKSALKKIKLCHSLLAKLDKRKRERERERERKIKLKLAKKKKLQRKKKLNFVTFHSIITHVTRSFVRSSDGSARRALYHCAKTAALYINSSG